MRTLDIILLILAAACFLVAALGFGVQNARGRTINIAALGLLFWVLVPLITLIHNS